jgi:hypothetical protein
MLTAKERDLLTKVYDTLMALYTLKERAHQAENWRLITRLEQVIDRLEAERVRLRSLDSVGTADGVTMKQSSPETQRRRHVREKATIDHLVNDLYTPKPPPAAEKRTVPGSTTSTGLSVEEQVRKEWDPRKGGLPIF